MFFRCINSLVALLVAAREEHQDKDERLFSTATQNQLYRRCWQQLTFVGLDITAQHQHRHASQGHSKICCVTHFTSWGNSLSCRPQPQYGCTAEHMTISNAQCACSRCAMQAVASDGIGVNKTQLAHHPKQNQVIPNQSTTCSLVPTCSPQEVWSCQG